MYYINNKRICSVCRLHKFMTFNYLTRTEWSQRLLRSISLMCRRQSWFINDLRTFYITFYGRMYFWTFFLLKYQMTYTLFERLSIKLPIYIYNVSMEYYYAFSPTKLFIQHGVAAKSVVKLSKPYQWVTHGTRNLTAQNCLIFLTGRSLGQ